VVIKTSGDSLSATSVSDSGGKQLFVKEIEEALLNETVDLAVHSAKDLPAELPSGLTITATLPREDPRDVLVIPEQNGKFQTMDASRVFQAIDSTGKVGTGSVRRIAQLSNSFRNVTFTPIRGNVETRLRKLDEGSYDVIILAAAGLIRLGLTHRISAWLSYDECLPAPGQGIVAIEIRSSDQATAEIMQRITDKDTMIQLEAERALVTALGGDCQVPIGAIATLNKYGLTLKAVVASPDGTRLLRRQGLGSAETTHQLGQEVAEQLINDGAADILAACS
jgi:hydroxymethylbilane synthase